IGVNVRHECFGRARINEKVSYDQYRPERKWDRQGFEKLHELKKICLTKSKDWAYEREHRIAIPIEKLENRNGRYFVSLHPQAVRRVMYGEQIDPEFFHRIECLLRHSDFS